MGEVWRATDQKLGREVAIKVLPEEFTKDPERLGRFEREARVLASLDHSNVSSIFGLEQEGEVRFLVMQIAEGVDLSERLSHGAIPLDESIAIALQIADGLEAAHARGIVHRDLKPANIKLADDGKVRILDFGLAKALDVETEDTNISNSPTMVRAATHAGMVLGTAAYMSPEQARGKSVDKRADIWAFGVVLWEMLTGKQLFGGDTVSDTLAAVLREEPDLGALPRDTPPSVVRLIRRCLQKNPRNRLHDIADARLELTESEPLPSEHMVAPRPRSLSGALPWIIALMAIGLSAWALLNRSPAIAAARPIVAKLPPPAGADFIVSSGLAISPDGTRIVFGARDATGKSQLWLQSLADGTVKPLAGTEKGRHPFWSPDSGAIGFFDEVRMKRVNLSDGVVEAFTDAKSTGRPGGTWNSEGVIVFASREAIYQVRASGGEVRRLTHEDGNQSGGAEFIFPSFLPDGIHFLYLMRDYAGAEAKCELMVGSLDGSPHKSLMRINSNAIYSPAGDLVWWQEGHLRAQPFDTKALELTGESRVVRSGVQFDPRVGLGMFSIANDGTLVYREGGVVSGDQLVRVDRSGVDRNVIGPPGNFYHPRLSPSGASVAVDQSDETNRGDIWIFDVERGTGTRLTSAAEDESNPTWSPDEQQLAFYSARDEEAGAVHVRSLRGIDDEKLVYKSKLGISPLSWSGNGMLLAEISAEDGDYNLGVVNLADGGFEPLLSSRFRESNGEFSPDGHFVAFESHETGRSEIYVQRFPDPVDRWRVSTGGGAAPFWRSDGRELYFLQGGSELVAASVTTSPDGSSLRFGDPAVLFSVHSKTFRLRQIDTRDGQTFVVNRMVGDVEAAPLTLVLNAFPGR